MSSLRSSLSKTILGGGAQGVQPPLRFPMREPRKGGIQALPSPEDRVDAVPSLLVPTSRRESGIG